MRCLWFFGNDCDSLDWMHNLDCVLVYMVRWVWINMDLATDDSLGIVVMHNRTLPDSRRQQSPHIRNSLGLLSLPPMVRSQL